MLNRTFIILREFVRVLKEDEEKADGKSKRTTPTLISPIDNYLWNSPDASPFIRLNHTNLISVCNVAKKYTIKA
ncbi:hypothetical protein KCTCHS21_30050 [Cohnella abietis]|uniref:Uncharacterized protein n=1 Tax=Cohnella abietis TaxID=2507935 RepID=A0A3T1D6A2_9BACL|nr:hypothetical protein KCTCHS21_30050 [Cohnella abietis]